MKILLSAEGPSPSDRVDPRFGRAPYLIAYDSSDESFVALDNSGQVQAAQGAGIRTAQRAVEAGPDVVLTGHCGPKAFAVLEEAGVKVYSDVTGTVIEAVHAWREGDAAPLAAPDSRGHRRP